MVTLDQQILALYPSATFGPVEGGSDVVLYGPIGSQTIAYWPTATLGMQPSQAQLDAASGTASLQQAQAAKIAAIDTKTQQLLAGGFSYTPQGTQTPYSFPLDLTSQPLWQATHRQAQDNKLTYPFPVGTVDNRVVNLSSQADVAAFYDTGFSRALVILSSAAAPYGAVQLKAQVQACTTADQVNAVTDNRT